MSAENLLNGRSVESSSGLEGGCGAAGGTLRVAAVPAAWVVEGQPPAGNTGGKLTTRAEKPDLTIKLDWLNTTLPCRQLQAVADLVSVHLGESVRNEWGKHTYRNHLSWESSAALFWTEGRLECLLSLNGDSLDFIPVEKQRQFLADLKKLGAKGTKIDIALDDYERRVSIEEIERAFNSREVCGFRLGERKKPTRWKGDQLEIIGDSFDLGRRGGNGSGKALKVYDKMLESGGEIDAIRWELKLSGERAEQVFDRLASCETDAVLVRVMTVCLGGCVDFKAEPAETHLDRRPRLAWWESLLSVLGSAKLVVSRIVPPLQRTLVYMRHSYARTLALARVIVEGIGGDFHGMIEEWAQQGERKIDWNRASQIDLGLDLLAIGSPRGIPI